MGVKFFISCPLTDKKTEKNHGYKVRVGIITVNDSDFTELMV